MQFLNPALLFGLAAVSVPIIIHLLNRRRFRRVPWAAMRFLKVSLERNQRRMKIEDLILLLLRCAFLALLALALARPTVDWLKSQFLGSKVSTVVVIDRSASMRADVGAGQTRFDLAKSAALDVLDALPDGSAAGVLLAADSAGTGIQELTLDLRLARRTIEKSKPSDRSTDLLPSLAKAFEILDRGSAVEKEVIVITDGQAEGWQQFETLARKMDEGRKSARVHVIFVGSEIASNIGVSGFRQVSALTPVGEPIRFEVEVTNYGKDRAENIPVNLEIDGADAGESFIIDVLPAGETKNATLFSKLTTEGYHRATASVPTDGVPGDDVRTIVLNATAGVSVLLVDGEPGREALDSETFFVRNALVPVPPDVAANYFIKVTTIPVADLGTANFSDHDVVFLCNVAEFPKETTESLKAFVNAGGGLVVFPGGNVNRSFYNRDLLETAALLPAEIGDPVSSADSGYLTLQASGYDHPMVSLWSDPGSGTLATARFGRVFALTPKEGESRVVLRFNDGQPAVVEGNPGLGKVFLFARRPADTQWNNLPVRPAFLPLMHRVVGSVIGRRDEGLNLPVGAPFRYRLGDAYSGKEAMVHALGRNGQSKGVLTKVGETLAFDGTDRAGAYEASISNPATIIQFATQPDPDESRLEMLSPEQRDRIGKLAGVVDFSPNTNLAEILGRERKGAELWMILLIAALAVALLEFSLSQWFSREK